MTYGGESWRLTKQLESKLRSAQRGMEQKKIPPHLPEGNRAEMRMHWVHR